MLTVTYAHIKAPYAEWRYAECRYAEFHYAECRGASILKMSFNFVTKLLLNEEVNCIDPSRSVRVPWRRLS